MPNSQCLQSEIEWDKKQNSGVLIKHFFNRTHIVHTHTALVWNTYVYLGKVPLYLRNAPYTTVSLKQTWERLQKSGVFPCYWQDRMKQGTSYQYNSFIFPQNRLLFSLDRNICLYIYKKQTAMPLSQRQKEVPSCLEDLGNLHWKLSCIFVGVCV